MITRMVEKIKKHYIALIVSGIVLGYIYGFIMKINNIPTENNWAAVIGILLGGLPLFSGLWIYSNKIKDDKKELSKIIKIFIIMFCIVVLITSSVLLIKDMASVYDYLAATNSIYTALLYSLTLILALFLLIRLWIFSNKIREIKSTFSKIIKLFVVWVCLVILSSIFVHLVQSF